MRLLFQKLRAFIASPRSVPWLFLAVSILAYGLFIGRYGFYWDDLPISWIRYELGVDAMRKYFSTARPVWAELYVLTTRVIPQVPLYWQIFALLWRWATVVLLWQIVRAIWRGHESMAVLAGLLFLLYPGFDLQRVSIVSAHFYIVLCFFFLSYLLTLQALKTSGGRYWLFTLGALVFSALNIWMLEYFYFLEMIRVVLLFYIFHQDKPGQTLIQIVRRTLLHWLPYLLVFIANILYRAFIFTNVAYKNVLLANLRANPLAATLTFIKEVASDLWLVVVQAWVQIFQFPVPAIDGPLTTLLFAGVVIAVGLIVAYFFSVQSDQTSDHRLAYWVIGIGFIAMLLGGGPYWLATLEVSLAFPASRFTLSFMLGVSLFLAGIFELIPTRLRRVLVTLLVAFAAGWQVMVGDAFRRDWEAQKNLFWQMAWRVPGMQPNTLVLMNEELSFYADNSISAPLNWIYSPKQDAQGIEHVLLYPTNRLGKTLSELKPGLPVHFSYIAGDFDGNTSDALAFYYDPPSCLRLLDPDLDSENRFILEESLMREASALTNTDTILRERTAVMPEIYGPEPAHGWCYYFERADLAGQFDDWEEVAKLGNQAFKLNDFPNNPVERFVFIEGYAHVGNWKRALELSNVSYKVSKDYVGPLLCVLWKRIETETMAGPEKTAALDTLHKTIACPSP